MPKLSCCLAILLVCIPPFVRADMISPEVMKAQERLRANPNLFDRYDSYCAGKRPGDACTIPGSTLAGGGNGTCKNEISDTPSMIDLTCRRAGAVNIDRKLPAGGFVHDADLCKAKAKAKSDEARKEMQMINCTPLPSVPTDRFCQGKVTGNPCTVDLTYDGTTERNEGVCKLVIETEGLYFWGRRVMKRDVIRCEAEQPVTHEYKPASWWKKLTQ